MPGRHRVTRDAASNVRGRVGFVARELVGRPTTHVDRLRDAPYRAAIRHPLFDMWVLDEIFRNRAYAIPDAVAAKLRALDHPVRVLDLGGHVGLFGLWFRTTFPDATFTSYEPDPENAATLRRCVAVNGLGDRWTVIEAAAAPSDGEATFISDGALSQLGGDNAALDDEHALLAEIFPFLRGKRLLTPKQVTVRTADVLPAMAECDFLKLDIQGGEWPLLMDKRFEGLSAAAFVLEMHPRAAPMPDPLSWVTKRFTRLGFRLIVLPAHGGERVIWGSR
ncbi:MAG TPA: FkbM family methyltransferase [Acidimicrobiales bacterium]|nr:FkbM family methyltransferase [Acidimicrobiales bacterium]